MNIYLYAAIYRPDEGEDQLIVVPSHVLADDEEHARMIASRAIPAEWEPHLSDIDVVVRPF